MATAMSLIDAPLGIPNGLLGGDPPPGDVVVPCLRGSPSVLLEESKGFALEQGFLLLEVKWFSPSEGDESDGEKFPSKFRPAVGEAGVKAESLPVLASPLCS